MRRDSGELAAARAGPFWWAWFALAAPVGTSLGAILGSPILVAALPVLAMYPAYWHGLGAGAPVRVFGQSLVWAASLSASILVWTWLDPASAGAVILNGAAYLQEMLEWIRTGRGAEGDPRQFLPVHATHFALFCAASILSAGLLGLLMGSVLMGYMSYYVGSMAALSAHPALAVLAGWHPWSVLRVAGFVACGVALSLPLRQRSAMAWDRRLLAAGVGLVVADAILKTLLAETWRGVLLSLS